MADKKEKTLSQAENQLYQEIADFIGQEVDVSTPPDSKLGDYAVPCFGIAQKLKKNPAEVAKELIVKFKPTEMLERAVAAGPYINFFVNKENFAKAVLTEIAKDKEKYGSSKFGKGERVMVEYFSPNTNKPLTIGHVRNIVLGESIYKLLRFTGYKVTRTTLYNDRGIAIVKAILGYQKWSEAKTPKEVGKKPDHFVGDFYVRFAKAEVDDKNLENEAKRALQAWEEDDPKVRKVWKKLMTWVLDGFKQTLKKLGVEEFDESYYESEFYTEGKQVVEQGLEKGIFIKDDEGLVVAPLEKYGLPDKIVLRPDSTSLYITQDLYLAKLKDKFNLDKSIYVVGSEQELYLKQLFKILEMLGYENAKNYYHLSYGMVRLPDGKIKSREGLASGTGADELISNLENLAAQEIKERFPDLSDKEIAKRSEAIAISALKFFILLVNPKSTIVFDPKKSLAFTGKTGPYLQYMYARINSLLEKSKVKITPGRVDCSVLTSQVEIDLIKILANFPLVIQKSVENYDASELSGYLYDLAKQFSAFYENSPILTEEEKVQKARLLLSRDVQIVLGTGLELLGITPIQKM